MLQGRGVKSNEVKYEKNDEMRSGTVVLGDAKLLDDKEMQMEFTTRAKDTFKLAAEDAMRVHQIQTTPAVRRFHQEYQFNSIK